MEIIKIIIVIIGVLLFVKFLLNYLEHGMFIDTKMSAFKKESCPQGGKHDIIFKDIGFTHQQSVCRKCNKTIVINK